LAPALGGRANLTVGQLASIAAALDAVIEINLRVVEHKPLVIHRTANHQR